MATDPRYTESMGIVGWFVVTTAISFFFIVFGTLIMIFLPFIFLIVVGAVLFCLYAQWDWERKVGPKKKGET